MTNDPFDEAVSVLADSRHLVLACHVGPDGDALGSMLGLGMAAKQAGKTVIASFGTPFTVSENYRFLNTDLLVPPSQVPDAPEVMVTFDAGSADRLGELAKAASNAETVVGG
ncbi:MAG: bifunctional oligoribonuclease/PAP phosphatase NrnA, partial [Acidimicrobiia bacterium]